jgi:sulfite exporter TauE/SafE
VFEFWTAYCSAHPWITAAIHWLGLSGTIPLLAVAGLLGGTTHCAGMCGPFVLAQVASPRDSDLNEGRRLVRAFLLPYHLGRFTTYVGLGALAGGSVGLIAISSGWHWLPAIILLVAAAAFVAYGTGGVLRHVGLHLPRFRNPLSRSMARITGPLLARPDGWRGYALGVALGFLPCGLLWGALGVAAGSGGPLLGALNMAAFAIGTMPSLIALGYLGAFFRKRASSAAQALSIPLMFGNATVLGYLAFRALA